MAKEEAVLEGNFPELKNVDINDSSLPEGKEIELNPLSDAWERAAPPPDGVYLVKLFEARNAYQLGMTDDKEPYYVANMECKIQESKEWEGTTIFGKVNTLLSAGKDISTMAGLMVKMGIKLPSNKLTPKQTVALLKKCLSKEPSLYVEGEWACWDMKLEEWAKRGMKNFPKDDNGKPLHTIRDSKGNLVNAKFKINRWFGLKEYRQRLEEDKKRGAGLQAVKGANGAKAEVVGSFEDVKSSSNSASSKATDEDFVIDI